jgi:putative ABC transport system permease protein
MRIIGTDDDSSSSIVVNQRRALHNCSEHDRYDHRRTLPGNDKVMALHGACASTKFGRPIGGRMSRASHYRRTVRSRVLDPVVQDLRYTLRTFFKYPGFTSLAVLTLGLGIGANTAMFSVVNAVLLRPLPYHRADRLVHITRNVPLPPGVISPVIALDDLQAWRESTRTFADIGFYRAPSAMTLTGGSDQIELFGAGVSTSTFSLLGVSPFLGRFFDSTDEQSRRVDVVVLSYQAWQTYFGADDTIVGKAAAIDGRVHTIIGVMPEQFYFPDRRAEMWLPAFTAAPAGGPPGQRIVPSFARVKDDVPIAVAAAEANAVFNRLSERRQGGSRPTAGGTRVGPGNAPAPVALVSMQERIVAPVQPALLVLTVAVGLVLVLACSNIASLLMSRAVARRPEIATRIALGATRGRLLSQLLTESLTLALLGGALGAAIASAGTSLLLAFDIGNLPRITEVKVDFPALAFTVLASLATGFVFGLAPAMNLSRTEPMQLMRGGAIGVDSFLGHARPSHLHNLLTVTQIAVATTLLIWAALMVRSFVNLSRVDLGFDPTNVLAFQLDMSKAQYSVPERLRLYKDVTDRLRGFGSIRAAAASNSLPFLPAGVLASASLHDTPEPVPFSARVVSPEYLAVMGIRLIRGQAFDAGDTSSHLRAVLVNRTMAHRIGEDPVGQSIILNGPFGSGPWQVIGIVEDVHHDGPAAEAKPDVYFDYRQWPAAGVAVGLPPMYIVVRTDGTPVNLLATARSIVQQIDPRITPSRLTNLEQAMSTFWARPSFYLMALGIFAGIATILAAIGIFGVVSYSVSQRTRELGIRLALGAKPSGIVAMILGQGMLLTTFGILLGLTGAAWGIQYLKAILFGLSPLDLPTFAASAVTLALIATVASYVPARRVMRLDPAITIRE